MDEIEQQLDEIIAQDVQELNDAPIADEVPTDEDIVEQEARKSGKPTKTTVLQRRTELSEEKLEQRIGQIMAKNAGKIEEEELRERIADKLEDKGRISEADLIQIKDSLLRKYEQEQEVEEDKPVTEQVVDTITGQKPLGPGKPGISRQFHKLADWGMGLKTPGGIGLLIGILMIFIWIIIPVSNGQTRMQLLWGVLTGQVGFSQNVEDREAAALEEADKEAFGGQSGDSFGGGGQSKVIPIQPNFDYEEWA